MTSVPHTPKIKIHPELVLAGQYLEVDLITDRTRELWMGFGPQIKNIEHRMGLNKYSVEVYPALDYFDRFDPHRKFQKWAAVPVSKADDLPEGIKVLHLPKGPYAVFLYCRRMGPPQGFYRRIYTEWLPASGSKLADRPHLAVMGPDYHPADPNSEETLWIPVQA